jgi:hypothetical protein
MPSIKKATTRIKREKQKQKQESFKSDWRTIDKRSQGPPMKKAKTMNLLWVALVTVAVVLPLRQTLLAGHADVWTGQACSAPAPGSGLISASCTLHATRQKLTPEPDVRQAAHARKDLWV